jgi:hemoglobin/transferrin/lactoferrin receptor protein
MTINYGVRFTSTKLKASWKETALINSLLSNYKINSKALTSSLGFTFRPTKKLKLNTIISSGFRNPNIDDIGKIRENLDFGINNYLKNSNLKFRTFCSLITRYIVRSTYNIFSDTTTPDINTILYDGNELKTIANSNLGNRFIYGGSFDGSFKISNSLDLNTNITITKAVLNKKYGPMPSISPIFGSTFITYQKNKLLLNMIFKFSGSKKPNTYSFGGEDGLEETPIINSDGLISYNGSPNWKIFSLNANYNITQKVLLKLGAENIFDIHYKEFASGISSSGRNISLGLNVDF